MRAIVLALLCGAFLPAQAQEFEFKPIPWDVWDALASKVIAASRAQNNGVERAQRKCHADGTTFICETVIFWKMPDGRQAMMARAENVETMKTMRRLVCALDASATRNKCVDADTGVITQAILVNGTWLNADSATR